MIQTKHYLIFPTSWLTCDLMKVIDEQNPTSKIMHIFDDNDEPTKYLICNISCCYKNEFKGYRKLSRDQTRIVIANILDGSVKKEDYYQEQ